MDVLIAFIILLSVGYFVGSYIERKSFAHIREREAKTLHVPMVTYGAKQPLPDNVEAAMFVGSVVVCADYFKIIVAGLRNLVGGRVTVYESVLDRGRREAILRMKEQAIAWGGTQIANVRLETADVGSKSSQQGIIAIEVAAYCTALRERSLPRG